MLVTPEQCCSITISIITVWALLNPCCIRSIPSELPVTPCGACGNAEWNTELHSLTAEMPNTKQRGHPLAQNKYVYSQQWNFRGTFFFICKDPWKWCFLTPGSSLGFGLSASDNLGETPIIRMKSWPEETPGRWTGEKSTVKRQLTKKENNLASSAWRQWTKNYNGDIACLRLGADS